MPWTNTSDIGVTRRLWQLRSYGVVTSPVPLSLLFNKRTNRR